MLKCLPHDVQSCPPKHIITFPSTKSVCWDFFPKWPVCPSTVVARSGMTVQHLINSLQHCLSELSSTSTKDARSEILDIHVSLLEQCTPQLPMIKNRTIFLISLYSCTWTTLLLHRYNKDLGQDLRHSAAQPVWCLSHHRTPADWLQWTHSHQHPAEDCSLEHQRLSPLFPQSWAWLKWTPKWHEHVCVYVHAWECVHVHVWVCVFMQVHLCVCIHVNVYLCACMYVWVCVHASTCVRVCICM